MIVASLKAMDRPSIAEAVERLLRHGVDGLLFITPELEGADALLQEHSDAPLVAVEAGLNDQVPVVAVDQFAGAVAATRHLLDLGHATVFHIAGPPTFIESGERVEGWRTTLEDAGADAPPPLIGDWSARAGYDLGRRLSRDPAVTAIFVGNDQMALGVLRALHENGRRVPEDVSVVGFDDIPEAPYFLPPLTTVRQDFDELGRRGVMLLLRIIEAGERLPSGPRVPPELVVRGSTGVAARAR
jgi:DNA-binding LacI/PurR family transcriptional regulator